MRPDRFEDIIALIALYRPGPMEQLGSYFRRKHGEEEITYAHPDLEPILARSYGLIVYQEQVMGITRIMGGYSAGEADMFRKAIGKKLVPLIRAEINKFIDRAIARGYKEDSVRAIGEQIFDFGRYGFNLGHATGYGFITYWTAYLKANFPTEFFTANLNSQVGVLDKIGPLLRDCEKRGIRILPPDINESGRDFTLMPDGSIRFGIGGVKGVGDAAVQDILETRDSEIKNIYSSKRVQKVKPDDTPYTASERVTTRGINTPGPYLGITDFIKRAPTITCTTTVKKALILAGAFGTGLDFRRIYFALLDDMNVAIKKGKTFTPSADVQMMPELELLKKEKELMGFYLTQSPLQYYKDELDEYGATYNGSYESLEQFVSIGGQVSSVRTHMTAKGEMAWVTLENDMPDLPRITVFAGQWKLTPMKVGDVVIINGEKDEHPKFGKGIKAVYVKPVGTK
jgi:DNA polymerase-3 subunit alpha